MHRLIMLVCVIIASQNVADDSIAEAQAEGLLWFAEGKPEGGGSPTSSTRGGLLSLQGGGVLGSSFSV